MEREAGGQRAEKVMGREVAKIEQNCLSKHSAKKKRVNLRSGEKHSVKEGYLV